MQKVGTLDLALILYLGAFQIGAAYLLGSVPFSFFVARWFGVKDVRQVGSGNVGATNVMRSAGKGAGFIYRGAKLIKKVREEDIVRELRAEIDAWIAERRAAETAGTAS